MVKVVDLTTGELPKRDGVGGTAKGPSSQRPIRSGCPRDGGTGATVSLEWFSPAAERESHYVSAVTGLRMLRVCSVILGLASKFHVCVVLGRDCQESIPIARSTGTVLLVKEPDV